MVSVFQAVLLAVVTYAFSQILMLCWNMQSWQQSSRLASPPEAFENNTSEASQAWGRVNDQSIQV
jgi:hypothetical protein